MKGNDDMKVTEPAGGLRASAVNRKLLDAAMAADALLHKLVGERAMTEEERAVCDGLVQAIGEALAAERG